MEATATDPAKAQKQATLRVRDLSIGFGTDEGITAITDQVSFSIARGETYGLVGESGCGKTVTCLALLQLLPQPRGLIMDGQVHFQDHELSTMDSEAIRKVRGSRIGMIFQEPAAALNPLMPVERQLLEVFEYHEHQEDPPTRIRYLLDRVGIPDPERVLDAYPHELSGGMLQRVMIAMALSLSPDLLIADEPTTALDVTVQAQIMELLLEMQAEHGTSILMVTHNMGLIAHYADRVGVMYAGRLIEEGPVETFLENPLHPYSRGLLDAIPGLHGPRAEPRPIPGSVPQPKDFPVGCRFYDRCKQAHELCHARPTLSHVNEQQKAACFLY